MTKNIAKVLTVILLTAIFAINGLASTRGRTRTQRSYYTTQQTTTYYVPANQGYYYNNGPYYNNGQYYNNGYYYQGDYRPYQGHSTRNKILSVAVPAGVGAAIGAAAGGGKGAGIGALIGGGAGALIYALKH